MSKKMSLLPIFIFIDAFGWQVLQKNKSFLKSLCQDERELKSILGYSSACDPSIISGMFPNQHQHWSAFYYDPQNCPYKWLRNLKYLPSSIMDYHRTRHYLSKLIKQIHHFDGYFQLYNMPFEYLPIFNYAEKYRIWKPDGLIQGKNIFNLLNDHSLRYYVHDSCKSDTYKLEKLKTDIADQSIDFAYISLGALDALQHRIGIDAEEVKTLVQDYQNKIEDLLILAKHHYHEVPVYIFSDHGMHNVHKAFDLPAKIASCNLTYKQDYVAVYDSTMARFWFMNDHAKFTIKTCLNNLPVGNILTNEELKKEHVYFSDSHYGECIFLLNPGIQIAPSHMGKKANKGMHGYATTEADTSAMILSNKLLPKHLSSIQQIYFLMIEALKLQVPEAHPNYNSYLAMY